MQEKACYQEHTGKHMHVDMKQPALSEEGGEKKRVYYDHALPSVSFSFPMSCLSLSLILFEVPPTAESGGRSRDERDEGVGEGEGGIRQPSSATALSPYAHKTRALTGREAMLCSSTPIPTEKNAHQIRNPCAYTQKLIYTQAQAHT